ncbi:MAG: 30S ribosomal protein S1 [bacterium]|nr:30S ribosomal protein S1 [bacterium]
MGKKEKDEIFQLIDKTLLKVKEGEIVEGELVRLSAREAIVDIGLKSEGLIPLSEFDNPAELKVGDKFEVLVEGIEGDEGFVILSKKKADSLRVWERIEESYKNGIAIEGKIIKAVKGGCIADLGGVEGFIPGSQLDIEEVKDMDKFVGETVKFRVVKLDKSKGNIVLSRKIILEKELMKKREEFWNKVEEGSVLKGVVKNITAFGVFVDIGGVDGLVHISDLSWGRITHPSEVLQVGDKVDVKVINVDRENQRLALGIKQLTPYPWDGVEERYPIGSKVKGKITSLTEYGAFVELEPGIEGLIHISEMSWTQRIRSPADIVAVGDTVHVVVLNIDKAQEKISLGLRQTQPNPWEKVKENYPEGSIVTGTVKSFSNFGAFIELKDGIEGLLHVKDLDWTEHIEHPSDVLKRRQKIKCKVLAVDSENQRIALGLKQMEKDPLIILKESINEPVKGKIKEIIADKGVVVKFNVKKAKVEGFVPFSHLTKSKLKKTKDTYKIGEELNLKVLEVDEERRRVILSEKELLKTQEEEEYKEYLKGNK